jgi:hypothetical protein
MEELEGRQRMTVEREEKRKPYNYWDELTPAQWDELTKIDAAAAEVKRIKEIGNAQRIFSLDNLERFKIYVSSGSGSKPKKFRLKSKFRLRPRPQIHYQFRPRPKPVHQLAKESGR